MDDSDDGIHESSIFDLDHAPPPPPPIQRGVPRNRSPQAKRGSYTLSPLKQNIEKLSGRSRIWSTESVPTVKSIWSDNIMEPRGVAKDNKAPPLPTFLERYHSSAGSGELDQARERRSSEFSKSASSLRNVGSTDQHENRRPSFKEFVMRNLSPQPSYKKQLATMQDLEHEEEDDEEERSLDYLDDVPELPFDRSSGSLASHQDSSRRWRSRRGGSGEESMGSLSTENERNSRSLSLSQDRRVTFGDDSLDEAGELTMKDPARSPDLSNSEVLGEVENSSSSEVDYEYGDPVDLGEEIDSDPYMRSRSDSRNSVGNSYSEGSDQKHHDETEFDTDNDEAIPEAMSPRPAVVLAGIPLPKWFPKLPSITDVSVKVVTYCFCGCWCGRSQQQLTDRSILGRLNVLIALLSVFPICASVFLALVLFSPFVNLNRQIRQQTGESMLTTGPMFSLSETLWNMNGRVLLSGLFSLTSFCASVFTWRVVRDVDLLGAIRYLWVLVWILPCYLFCAISLFDRFNTTKVWVQQFWRSPQMAWFRKRYCHPTEYYNTLCSVPMTSNETQWCLDNYNSTSCSVIRDEAQFLTIRSLHFFYGFTAVWDFLLVFILLLAINALENIISKPLVQKSRESNVPGWLTLPCLGCLGLGGFLTFASQSSLSTEVTNRESIAWLIGPMYVVTGGCFLVAALLSWYISNVSILSTMDKRRKLFAVYLFTADMVILVLLLLGICGVGIAYIVDLARNTVSDQVRGDFACRSNYLGVCTACEQSTNRCPEWSAADVTSILQQQAKASATVAAIFVCYCFSSIRFGVVMMNRISLYQIAYV